METVSGKPPNFGFCWTENYHCLNHQAPPAWHRALTSIILESLSPSNVRIARACKKLLRPDIQYQCLSSGEKHRCRMQCHAINLWLISIEDHIKTHVRLWSKHARSRQEEVNE